MGKEKLTKEINELMINISEYYGVLENEQNAIYKYLKNCEKALLDLLNEFDKDGKKINKLVLFENIFNYKNDYETLNKDYKNLEKQCEILEKEFDELEERYEGEKDNTYVLTEENEKLQEKIEELKERLDE